MNAEKMKPKATKVAVSLRSDLVDWIDSKAQEMGISRSGYISMCITHYKQALEVQPRLNGLMDSLASVMNGFADGSLPVDQAQMRLAEIDAQYSDLKNENTSSRMAPRLLAFVWRYRIT